jgi:hypothetical protein
MKGSLFTNNTVSDTESVGGALYMDSGAAVVETCTFRGNAAGYAGGAVGLEGSASLTLLSSKLEGNTGQYSMIPVAPKCLKLGYAIVCHSV